MSINVGVCAHVHLLNCTREMGNHINTFKNHHILNEAALASSEWFGLCGKNDRLPCLKSKLPLLAANAESTSTRRNNDLKAETLGMGVDEKISLNYFHWISCLPHQSLIDLGARTTDYFHRASCSFVSCKP